LFNLSHFLFITFVVMEFKFQKQEKLKRKKLIEQLFKEGKSVTIFPLRLFYLQCEHGGIKPIRAGFSVSKKKFKRAVDRNRIKRQLREAYRLNKAEVYKLIDKKYIIMIIFVDNKKYDSRHINLKTIRILKKFLERVC